MHPVAQVVRERARGGSTSQSAQQSGAPLRDRAPQGVSKKKFEQISKKVRDAVGHLTDEIGVHGSRAKGTATPGKDIDIGIRVSKGTFKDIMRSRFGRSPGSKTKIADKAYSDSRGIIKARKAGLAGLRNELEQILGMKVDLSFVRIKGVFDKGPWINLWR